LTNPSERIPKDGWGSRVPRTPDEFAKQWKESKERKQLLAEIEQYESEHPIGGQWLEIFKHSRSAQQASRMCVFYLAGFLVAHINYRSKLGVSSLRTRSRFQCRFNFVLGAACGDFMETWRPSTPPSLVILLWLWSSVRFQPKCLTEIELNMAPQGSVFYNLPDDTASFYSRGALLFFSILMNAFASALEVCANLLTM
jgi:hypothetical protein